MKYAIKKLYQEIKNVETWAGKQASLLSKGSKWAILEEEDIQQIAHKRRSELNLAIEILRQKSPADPMEG